MPCNQISSNTNLKNGSPLLIWHTKIPNTQLEQFQKLLEKKFNMKFDSYWELHKWSVENFPNFWAEAWNYYGIISSEPYYQIYRNTGNGLLDCEWFCGAKFNFAENLLRIRDDSVAIIYSDQEYNDGRVTFAELFEEVKLYAAAFRKHGLRKGDRVGCYMSNRKEAVFTFLAAASIGAIFGGQQPFYGSRPLINIVRKIEPKFLITIDHHTDADKEYHNIDNLPEIVNNTLSLEKVIVIATKPETTSKDILSIKNGILLEDFLKSGHSYSGSVPDIVFEQLPFNYPLCINFTSGTSGLPKAPVHSAGTILSHLNVIVLDWNLKRGDILMNIYASGWTMWHKFLPCLARGITLFLYAGSPLYARGGSNFWDLLSQYKVTYTYLVGPYADKLEKLNISPGPDTDLRNLKMVALGGCPIKVQNCLYIRKKTNEKVFVGSLYGATENFGAFSCFSMNLPCYAGEIQGPPLGMDIQCFDENGNSVVGKRGEMVIATPTPSLPLYLWKDAGNKELNENFLSKFPGVWCQHDEIRINPQTKGFLAIGRSDDTLIQNGDNFGASDVYYAIHDIEEIQDSICVSQSRSDGDCRAVLFVKMKDGYLFTSNFKEQLSQKIAKELWHYSVPKLILEIEDIPYNLNNKKMEGLVRKIIAINQIPIVGNVKNPESLKYFCNIPELVKYNQQ